VLLVRIVLPLRASAFLPHSISVYSLTNDLASEYLWALGDGLNLFGTLDVDAKRARFVAAAGMFGTAYQFVMPRDQIQIVRVPTAEFPYNALARPLPVIRAALCSGQREREPRFT